MAPRSHSGKARGLRALPLLFVGALVTSIGLAAPAANAVEKPTQTEVVINRAFDGTAPFSAADPLNNDATGAHTPGLDLNQNNWVVRTHDGFGVRVDWDVNESSATDLTMVISLKNGVSQPATEGTIIMRPEGFVSGCDPAKSSLSADQLTYTCYLGNVPEGSHGTIFPVFKLENGLDGTPMNVSATLKSKETAEVSSGPLTFFVSESPSADWLKQTVITRPVTGGYVVMFPLTLRDNNQVDSVSPPRGTGLLRYTAYDFYDHGYKLPKDTVVATAAQLAEAQIAGPPCGNYDAGNGTLVGGGQFPVNPNATFTCSQVATSPYLLTKISVTPAPSVLNTPIPAPKTLANGNPNYGGLVYAAQIAYFVPAASAVDNVAFGNALSAVSPLIDPANPTITNVPVDGSGKSESDTTNNITQFGFGSGSGGGGGTWNGGTYYSHYGLFSREVPWAPYNRDLPKNVYAYGPLWVPFYPSSAAGTKFPFPPQAFKPWQSTIDPPSFWDGNGVVTRNTPVTMNLALITSNIETTPPQTPLHGCMTWSLNQVNLRPIAGQTVSLDITNTAIINPNSPATGTPNTFGNFVGPLPAPLPTHKFDILMSGQAPPPGASRNLAWGTLGPTLGSAEYVVGNGMPTTSNIPQLVPFPADVMKNLQIIVEYAQDKDLGSDATANPVPFDAPINSVECNNKNPRTGAARKWVNLDTISAADLATYEDPAQPGTYLFNMVRVRTVGNFPWSSPWVTNNGFGASGIVLSVSGVTGNDLNNVNKDGTEVILHTSRSLGAWDPATQDGPSTKDCKSWIRSNPPMFDKAIEDDIAAKGGTTQWCNMRYMTNLDTNVDSFAMTLDPNSFSWAAVSPVSVNADVRFTGDSDSDRITIVGVRPVARKTNLAGQFAIADNGNKVTFKLDVGAVGTDIEALTNYVVTDVLDPQYRFISIDVPFNSTGKTPGARCTTPPVGQNGTITCQLSRPNPLVPDGDLLPGLPGGWSDSMTITVEVQNAQATATSNKGIPNTVSSDSSGTGEWDPVAKKFVHPELITTNAQNAKGRAYSYLPAAHLGGKVVKTVGGNVGKCPLTPPTAPTDEPWADRCSLITLDASKANEPTNDADGNMIFTLNYTNTASLRLTTVRLLDVLPYNGDGTELGSDSATPKPGAINGAKPSTVGDGRTPNSQFVGDLGYKSSTLTITGASVPSQSSSTANVVYYYTGDAPATIARDPDLSIKTNTWCKADGTKVFGTGSCPANLTFAVTGIMAEVPGLIPGETASWNVTLDAEANSCSSLYTNTFGARASEIWLPIRSNDVSYMVNCKFDQALQKRVSSAWKPGGDGVPWVTYGQSTVDFEIEVINQGDPIQDFDVSDYVDTRMFKFLAADNPAGTTKPGTLGSAKTGPALAYTWSGADGTNVPLAKVVGKLGVGQSVIIPIRLRVLSLKDKLINHAEISRFDDDGNPANGDSNPANPKNPTSGPLRDIDSTPDAVFGNDREIDNAIDLTPATGDEDDEDLAEVPWYDLALVKDLANGQPQTVVFNGNTALVKYNILVKNQSLYPTSNVKVIDTPPAGFAYDKSNPTGKQTVGGVPVTYNGDSTFTINTLNAGQQVSIPVTYVVTAADALSSTKINTAEIFSFADAAGVAQLDVDSNPDTDPNNDAYVNPELGPEADGGESPDFDVNGDGDLHNRAKRTIDEDDHDREVVAFDYSLGNEVWIDKNNNGKVDSGEAYLPGVKMLLFADANNDGKPDDKNADGKVSEADAIAMTTTDKNGLYVFSRLAPSGYIVGVSATNFATGGPLALYRSSDPTSTKPDDNVDQDDNGIPDAATGMVMSGTITIGGAEPVNEPGPRSNDTNADILSNLTIDFGFFQPVVDVALRKTLSSNEKIMVGDTVTFKIEVFNQGNYPLTDLTIVDYPPATLGLADANWVIGEGGYPYRSIPGILEPGQSVSIEISFKALVAADVVSNHSEVATMRPLGPNGQTLTYQNGQVVKDIDSTPDNKPGDIEIDNEINLTPATGDEDDEDIASIKVVKKGPVTGGNIQPGMTIGFALLGAGVLAYGAARRRRRVVRVA